MARTEEQVRKDIEAERERLATALDELRGSITRATKKALPVAAGATALLGIVLGRRRRR